MTVAEIIGCGILAAIFTFIHIKTYKSLDKINRRLNSKSGGVAPLKHKRRHANKKRRS